MGSRSIIFILQKSYRIKHILRESVGSRIEILCPTGHHALMLGYFLLTDTCVFT